MNLYSVAYAHIDGTSLVHVVAKNLDMIDHIIHNLTPNAIRVQSVNLLASTDIEDDEYGVTELIFEEDCNEQEKS